MSEFESSSNESQNDTPRTLEIRVALDHEGGENNLIFEKLPKDSVKVKIYHENGMLSFEVLSYDFIPYGIITRDLTIENSEESHKFVHNIKLYKLKGEEKIEICNIDDLEDTEILSIIDVPYSDAQFKIEDYEYVFKCFNRSKLRSIFENNIYLNFIQYDYYLYYYEEDRIENKIIRSIRNERLRLKLKYVEDFNNVRTTEDYEVFFGKRSN